MTALQAYETLRLGIFPNYVAYLELTRGSKSNAVNMQMWDELPKVQALWQATRSMWVFG